METLITNVNFKELAVQWESTENVQESKIVNKLPLEELALKELMDHVYGLKSMKMMMDPRELVSDIHHARV